jgi:tetratricopeptide (TPR) repeat protein
MSTPQDAYSRLKQWQKALKLTDGDTDLLNAEMTMQSAPKQKQQDLQFYEKRLEEAMLRQVPLSDQDQDQLDWLQQVLHLTAEEVQPIRDRLSQQYVEAHATPPSPDASVNPYLEESGGGIPLVSADAALEADALPAPDPALAPTISPVSGMAPPLADTVISRPPDGIPVQSANVQSILKRKLEMEGATIATGAAVGAVGVAVAQAPIEQQVAALLQQGSAAAPPETKVQLQQTVLNWLAQEGVITPAAPVTQSTAETVVQPPAVAEAAVAPPPSPPPVRTTVKKVPWYQRPEVLLGTLFAIALGLLGGAWWFYRSERPIAANANPEAAQPFVDAGNVKSRQAEFAGAIADYSQAIQLDPSNASTYVKRGYAYHQVRNYSQAISDLNQALVLDGNLAEAYSNRSHVRFDQGNLNDALNDAEQAIQRKPDLGEAYLNRGNVSLARDNIDAAAQDYDKAVQLRLNNFNLARAYNNRGNVLARKDNLTGAINDYDKATQLDPNYADAFYNRGLALERNQDLNGALQGYRDAAKLYQAQGNGELAARAQSRADGLANRPSPAPSPSPTQTTRSTI